VGEGGSDSGSKSHKGNVTLCQAAGQQIQKIQLNRTKSHARRQNVVAGYGRNIFRVWGRGKVEGGPCRLPYCYVFAIDLKVT